MVSKLVCVLVVIIVAGCSAKTPYPSDWSEAVSAESACRQPAGSFANLALRTTDEDTTLELKQVFFNDLLNGFEVTHLSFEAVEDGSVRIRPWVGETMLNEVMVLTPVREGCRDEHWRLDTGWDVDGYMIATGLLWTGGVLVPAAGKGYYTLGLTTRQELIVHATVKMAGVFALVIPFRTRIADEWFLYSPYEPAEPEHAELEDSLADSPEADADETN